MHCIGSNAVAAARARSAQAPRPQRHGAAGPASTHRPRSDLTACVRLGARGQLLHQVALAGPRWRQQAQRAAAAAAADSVPSPPAAVAVGLLDGATKRKLLAVSSVAFVDFLSYSFVFPLLPFFAARCGPCPNRPRAHISTSPRASAESQPPPPPRPRSFGATHTQTGLLVASFALTQMLASPFLVPPLARPSLRPPCSERGSHPGRNPRLSPPTPFPSRLRRAG